MTRQCNVDDCQKPARPGRRICNQHRHRLARHGDPHFTQWTVADEHDVESIVRNPRPVEGLTRLERILVARGLHARDEAPEDIARVLEVSPRTVWRWVAAGREAA